MKVKLLCLFINERCYFALIKCYMRVSGFRPLLDTWTVSVELIQKMKISSFVWYLEGFLTLPEFPGLTLVLRIPLLVIRQDLAALDISSWWGRQMVLGKSHGYEMRQYFVSPVNSSTHTLFIDPLFPSPRPPPPPHPTPALIFFL